MGVSECLCKVHLAMLLRILRKSVCVNGTGGACMPNLHTLYHWCMGAWVGGKVGAWVGGKVGAWVGGKVGAWVGGGCMGGWDGAWVGGWLGAWVGGKVGGWG